ncbi:MAG TPA: hypothetical protein VN951_03110 [Pyrinomonadaceae bacterium]|nr:hypothetical protein [Pyrinomonadaceae bacterium]
MNSEKSANGGVDAAARIQSSIAGLIKLRNTLPPLASNDLFDSAATERDYRSRIYLPSKPSNSKYASFPGTHEISVPASMPTVFTSASDKDISRPSISRLSDMT